MTAFIVGPAGSGKTTELLRRIRAAAEEGPLLVTSPSDASLAVLRSRIEHANAEVCCMHALALLLLPGAQIIDDVRAATLFEESAQPLLQLSWTEFMQAEIDPEVPGLRAPVRFLDSAFRLFSKLRDGRITPERFLELSLQKGADFYAKPPNLAHAELLGYTKDVYRDSLDAAPAELQRQYRREVDLAKILAKLYRSYLDYPVNQGCLTLRDAVAGAAAALENDSGAARRLRERYPQIFVDDAQELTTGELQFLQAIYGKTLDGVTFAGDPDSATSTFRGARPDPVFALPGERLTLEQPLRGPAAISAACRHLLGTPDASAAAAQGQTALTLFRASTPRAEAQFIADRVIELLAAGAAHDEIAILFRSVCAVRLYCDALLERNVRVQVAGDLNLFREPETLDALAVLWSLHDPFRHDYLLRVLSGRALSLSDASLYALCAEPPDAQTLLFNETAAAPESRSGRWDSKRDLRLGWNVVRGDQDERLSDVARARLRNFRDLRGRWLAASTRLPLPQLVRLVWSEGLAASASADEAFTLYQQQTLARLYDRVKRFSADHANVALGDFLEYAQVRMDSSFEAHETSEIAGAVRILSIDAARGREFDHVLLPNVRAGSFPRWYVPDAFLFSPKLGTIAKENAGDARAARTAKFTYYMFRSGVRESYNAEERRAFVYALRRARRTALVSASERATRGVTAPEFLSELQAAHLPGTLDVSDRWRPARTVYSA